MTFDRENTLMKLRSHLLFQAMLVGLVVLASGCKMPTKPKAFNNKIARGNKRLADSGRKLYKALVPLMEGKAPSSDAQSAYNEAKTALTELKQEFAEIKPPVNSPEGQDLLEVFLEFLDRQQEIFDNTFTPMLRIAQNNSMTPSDRWTLISPYLEKASADGRPKLNKLRNAQKAFCKANSLEDIVP
jgi:hypothetical protein